MMMKKELFFRKYYLYLSIVLLSIFFNNCNPLSEKIGEFSGKPIEGNEFKSIEISYEARDDSAFGGTNAKAIFLRISNNSSEPIDGMVIVINGRYKARLSEVYYYFKSEKSHKRYGSDNFPANSSLAFSFSHDECNHLVFRDERGEPMPTSELIYTILLESGQKVGKWVFPEHDGNT